MGQRMREAEAYRRSRETRAAQSSERQATLRKIATATIHLLAWPIRH